MAVTIEPLAPSAENPVPKPKLDLPKAPKGPTNYRLDNKDATDPFREYVWGSLFNWAGQPYRPLPLGMDDLDRDFPDIYEKMLIDAKVKSSLETLKLGVLSQGLALLDRMPNETDEDHELSKEITQFCHRNLDRLQKPFPKTLYQMMNALAFGHTISEKTYEYPEDGPDVGRICLKSIKVKPRKQLSFVVDQFFNVLGLTATRQYSNVDPTMPIYGTLLPREKFAIFAPFEKEEDPRGQSLLRAAYPSWWMKTQSWPEHLRYLAQFASPMLVGYTPPNSQAQSDGKGGVINAQQVLLSALISARNGAAMAFPAGTKVEAISVGNGGATFLDASRLFDEQISMAILLQTLATGEGIHQTRASSQVHQDVLGMLIRWVQGALANMIEYDILRPLIRYNWPGDIGDRLCPIVQIGSVSSDDFAGTLSAVVGAWQIGYLADEQIDAMDKLIGLPKRKQPPQRPPAPGALPGAAPAPGDDMGAGAAAGDMTDAGAAGAGAGAGGMDTGAGAGAGAPAPAPNPNRSKYFMEPGAQPNADAGAADTSEEMRVTAGNQQEF